MGKIKLLICVIAAAAVLCTGCGDDNVASQKPAEPAGQASASQEPDIGEKQEDVTRIGLITGALGIEDGGAVMAAWEGLQRAEADLELDVVYLPADTGETLEKNADRLAEKECDLIIGAGKASSAAVEAAAEKYPDITFLLIDAEASKALPNLTCVLFSQEETAYLAGVTAALATKSGQVGFIAGEGTGESAALGAGFASGVHDTDPGIVIQQADLKSFTDAALGKSTALSMIENGADVIFHAAGAAGDGVIEGCSQGNAWVIGSDGDQSALAPVHVLTSIVKQIDMACAKAVEAYEKGALESGAITYGLKDGCVDLATNTDNLTVDMIAALKAARDKLSGG